MPPTLLYAAGSDVGRRRAMNQDSAAASTRLLVVADGMGGHAHGEVASAVAVEAVMELEKRLAADLSDVDLTASSARARRGRRPAHEPRAGRPGVARHRHHGRRVPRSTARASASRTSAIRAPTCSATARSSS